MATLLVVGGCTKENEKGALRSIDAIRLEERVRALKVTQEHYGEMQIPRRSPSVFFNRKSGELLVFGGCETTGQHLNSAEIFVNGISKRVSAVDGMESHSCAAYCSLNDGESMIIGGFDGPNCLKQVIFVDQNGSAKKFNDFCSRLKNSIAVPLTNDSVLLIGGWDEKETLRTVFRVTFDKNRESYATAMEGLLPYPVEGHGTIKRGNILYIVGGYDGIHVRSTIIRMDLESGDKKILLVELETARENHACAVLLNKYLVVAGGWDGRRSLNSIEVFEILEGEPFLEKVSTDVSLSSERNRPGFVVF